MNSSVRRPIRNNLEFVKKRVWEFVFPPLCLLCDQPRSAHRWFCEKCRSDLILNRKNRNGCPRCGVNRATHQCACEFVWDYPFEKIVSLLDYTDPVQRIMHYVKYSGFFSLAYDMGREFAQGIPSGCFDGFDIAAPVPLHFLRRLRRGYNQAEWFAKGVLDESGVKGMQLMGGLLRRTRHTRTQTKLTKEERRRNLSNAFALGKGMESVVKGKKVVLFDDVVTTGSTVGLCTKVLLEAGCAGVIVVSMARD